MGKGLHNITAKVMPKLIHSTTAKICADVEQQTEELTDPEPFRRSARLVAVTVAGALLVVAIVVTAIRTPRLQSEKKNISSRSTDGVSSLLREAVKKGHVINCPCQEQVMSWCNVTSFHIYRANKGASTLNESRTVDLNGDDGGNYLVQICTQKNQTREDICVGILSPIINSLDSRTYLPTTTAFARPERLYEEITMRIDTNAVEQIGVYSFLGFINDAQSFNYSQGLGYLARDMQKQFRSNHASSSKDYWNASQETRVRYNLRMSIGMNVSWDMYLQSCKPSFCEIEYQISGLNRVVRAMAQVGGITSIIALALKFLIWPSLTFALRFPNSKI